MEPVRGAAQYRHVAHRALRHAPVLRPAADGTVWHPGVQRLHRLHLWRLPEQRRELTVCLLLFVGSVYERYNCASMYRFVNSGQ